MNIINREEKSLAFGNTKKTCDEKENYLKLNIFHDHKVH